MNRGEFFELLIENISFKNLEEKEKFLSHYNEIIDDMILNGMNEELAINTLNYNEIIEQYNLLNIKEDYKKKFELEKIKKDRTIFSISIIAGVLIPMLITFASVIFLYVFNEMVDFGNHSIRLLFILVLFFSYEVYFRVNEVWHVYKSIKKLKLNNQKITIKNILIYIMIHMIFSLLTILLMILYISNNYILIIVSSILLLTPYVYLYIKKRRIIYEDK